MPSDVIVVGAGPAGAIAATILARQGAKVTMFDRARFPRAKLCGDTVNPGALRVLSMHIRTDDIVRQALPLAGMVLTGPGVSVQGAYGGGELGHAITRRALDTILVREAIRAGVDFHDGAAVDMPVVDTTGAVTGVVVATRDGRRCEARAAFVIAADGRESRLARACRLSRHPLRPRRWAIGGYFANARIDSHYGEMHVRRGHYVGVAPVPGGLANVCLVIPYVRGGGGWRDPVALLGDVIRRDPVLADRFVDAGLVDRAQVLGPMAVDAGAAGMPGLLLAGDAAGFIDPITGDGLRFAVEGGAMAASVVAQVLDGRCSCAEAPTKLGEKRRAAFARKWRFNRTIRALLTAPAAVSGAAAAARVLPAAFQAVIRYAGDCR